ncbi:hypothetical protein ACFLSJ_09330, partial [Verrucomicrobiota bacterium]
AEGWSPSRVAWESRKAGLYAAGLCDFDVLDGAEEFMEGGHLLGLRATVNLETRVYLEPYADAEISSPGEPGVTYIMGAGFAREPSARSPQGTALDGYRQRARERNEALIGRINPHLPDIAVDYRADVLPLTPAGAATERHIISAYLNKARSVFEHASGTAEFWARVLERDIDEVVVLLADRPALEEAVRARLAKRGGIGYRQPSVDTFPPAGEFVRWVLSCGAIPMMTWLDGTSKGERDARALLECMTGMGVAAVNIIPDRNWNIRDPESRCVKIRNLGDMVAAAEGMGLPLNVGTEMNKDGLPFVDDLAGEVLRPHREAFLRGARVMVGHTVLLRYADYSYTGEGAAADFPDPARRTAFFERVGSLPPLRVEQAAELEAAGPVKALERLRQAAADLRN